MDWANMGLTRQKPEHPLRRIDINSYQSVFDFLKGALAVAGWALVEARFNPEAEVWHLYAEAHGERPTLITNVAHEDVEHILGIQHGIRKQQAIDFYRQQASNGEEDEAVWS